MWLEHERIVKGNRRCSQVFQNSQSLLDNLVQIIFWVNKTTEVNHKLNSGSNEE